MCVPCVSLQADTALCILLAQNPGLTYLDLSQNPKLPDQLLAAALTRAPLPNLSTLKLSGCEFLAPSYLATLNFTGNLRVLDLSGTAVDDLDLMQLAPVLERVTWLGIKGCMRVSDRGIVSLAESPAVTSGVLQGLCVGELPWVSAAAWGRLFRAWIEGQVLRAVTTAGVWEFIGGSSSSSSSGREVRAADGSKQYDTGAITGFRGGLELDVSHCGGVKDSSVAALLRALGCTAVATGAAEGGRGAAAGPGTTTAAAGTGAVAGAATTAGAGMTAGGAALAAGATGGATAAGGAAAEAAALVQQMEGLGLSAVADTAQRDCTGSSSKSSMGGIGLLQGEGGGKEPGAARTHQSGISGNRHAVVGGNCSEFDWREEEAGAASKAAAAAAQKDQKGSSSSRAAVVGSYSGGDGTRVEQPGADAAAEKHQTGSSSSRYTVVQSHGGGGGKKGEEPGSNDELHLVRVDGVPKMGLRDSDAEGEGACGHGRCSGSSSKKVTEACSPSSSSSSCRERWSEGLGVRGGRRVWFRAMNLAGCSGLSKEALRELAAAGLLEGLEALDLSHLEDLRKPGVREQGAAVAACPSSSGCNLVGADGVQDDGESPGFPEEFFDCLSAVAFATGGSLRSLNLDGCFISPAAASAIICSCSHQLHSLSIVGCTGLTNASLSELLLGLQQLRELNIGGGSSSWQEGVALAGVTCLEVLRVFRRSHLTDAQLGGVLRANRGLKELKLAGCYSLTDGVLEEQQQQQEFDCNGDNGTTNSSIRSKNNTGEKVGSTTSRNGGRGNSSNGRSSSYLQHLEDLTLVACDQLTGMTLSRLRQLRHLKVHGCPGITPRAVQQLLACCSRLVLLEVPGALMGGCMLPLQGPGGHLEGLKVVTEQGMPQRR